MAAPKGAKTEAGRKKLAKRVVMELRAGIRQYAVRQPRHDRLKALHGNDPPDPETKAFPDASKASYPIMQVKIDALGTFVMNVMTAQEPYCVSQTYKKDDTNLFQERVVGFFLVKDGLKLKLSAISPDMGLYNVGVLKTDWKTDGTDLDTTPSVEVTPIEVHDFVPYPAIYAELAKCKTVGDRFWLRRSQIKQAQRENKFFEVELPTQGGKSNKRAESQTETAGHVPDDNAGQNANDQIELFDVTFKADDDGGKEQWFRGTVAFNEEVFLTLDRHELDRPGYHRFSYKNDYTEFWSKQSVGNDLQGVQNNAIELFRNLIDGIKMNIYGAIFTQSAFMAEEYKTFGPGDIVSMPTVGDIVPYNPKADLNFIPQTLQQMSDLADTIARIRQISTAGAPDKGVTATAESISNQGQQAGLDDYIATASFGGLVSLFDYAHELIALHIDEWMPVFAEFLNLQEGDEERIAMPALWRPNTSSVGATPGAQIQLLQTLTERSQLPGSSIDPYDLDTRLVSLVARMGFTDSTGLQLPQQVEEVVSTVARRAGIDPQLIMDALEQAQETQELIQDGETVERKEDSIETIRVGMGLPEEKPCPACSEKTDGGASGGNGKAA